MMKGAITFGMMCGRMTLLITMSDMASLVYTYENSYSQTSDS